VLRRQLKIALARPVRQHPQNLVQVGEWVEVMKTTRSDDAEERGGSRANRVEVGLAHFASFPLSRKIVGGHGRAQSWAGAVLDN
jgi:hypothetical protein